MTVDIAAIRKGAASKLSPTPLNIRAYAYAPDAPTAPAAYIYPEPFTYDTTYDDGSDLLLVVRYLVSSIVTEGGQDQLDGFISQDGPTSGKVALEADQTLDGTCSSVHVTNMRNYGVLQIAAPSGASVRYFSAEQLVSIFV